MHPSSSPSFCSGEKVKKEEKKKTVDSCRCFKSLAKPLRSFQCSFKYNFHLPKSRTKERNKQDEERRRKTKRERKTEEKDQASSVSMTNVPARTRSVYRAILRELPSRPRCSPSPLQTKIRQHLSTAPADADAARAQLEEAEQFAQYVKAQRQYVTLLERYNPGADMDQEERVRLTARRVGMSLPIEHKNNSS